MVPAVKTFAILMVIIGISMALEHTCPEGASGMYEIQHCYQYYTYCRNGVPEEAGCPFGLVFMPDPNIEGFGSCELDMDCI